MFDLAENHITFIEYRIGKGHGEKQKKRNSKKKKETVGKIQAEIADSSKCHVFNYMV